MTPERKALLNRLIEKEWPKLRRFFRTKVADANVKDLAQATFLAYVEKQDAVDNDTAYLWGIARRMVLKHYEKYRPTEAFDSTIHTVMDVSRTFSSRLDEHNRLLRALHTLPVDHQMAFELRHGEELSLEEVAAALDVSLATAKRYIAAAEEKLRALLGADATDVRGMYEEI